MLFAPEAVRRTSALHLTPAAGGSLDPGAGTAPFGGDNGDAPVIGAVTDLNQDLHRRFGAGQAVRPEGRGWAPRFPPDHPP